jgi:hypothetical protein
LVRESEESDGQCAPWVTPIGGVKTSLLNRL